ncbi:Broad-complex core protein isoforms 1/2/3/4/5 [Amphibalanus amphitrite]|uniref:Broad-complex core protein isoforms 1/2/3/4/5 n=1 Tax=Amphibalanus amphitrite TaxID=1232801 RepID=A0A6A4WHW6_AMPAM|nr:Broad-complex core protein isoforms 1/2/3/4/5 [Amphibalanus amphitrite]
MADEGDAYRLKWQTHVPSLCTEFMELRKNESYVDVTLVCRGGQIKAHRLLLSSCSPLLERLLAANQEPEATLILPDLQDTDDADESRHHSGSGSDGSDQVTSHVTTTSQDDCVTSCVTSQMASTSQGSDGDQSDPETSLLNPQVELSEGEGRVRVKTEDMTSPMTSPVLEATAGSCVFCKKHFVSASDLRDHISRVHVTDRLEKQFKCDYCPAAFARSAHLEATRKRDLSHSVNAEPLEPSNLTILRLGISIENQHSVSVGGR